MPTIHVIFDPNDRLVGLKPEDMGRIGASAAVMSIATEEISQETIKDTAESLVTFLLTAIATSNGA